MGKPRRLSPRICRGCGGWFTPFTPLSRYGGLACKTNGAAFASRAVRPEDLPRLGKCVSMVAEKGGR